MPKSHDWNRTIWRNRSTAEERGEPLLARYENEAGDRVEYSYDDIEERNSYVVELNGGPIEDYTLDGEKFDDEHFEVLEFETRARAREATTQVCRQLPPLELNEDGEYEREALQAWAKIQGIPANESNEALIASLGLPEEVPAEEAEPAPAE